MVTTLLDQLGQSRLLHWHKRTNLPSCYRYHSQDTSHNQHHDRLCFSIDKSCDYFEKSSEHESVDSSDSISPGGEEERDDYVSDHDTCLHGAGCEFCDSFEEKVLEEDDSKHAVGEHAKGSSQKEKRKVLPESTTMKSHLYN